MKYFRREEIFEQVRAEYAEFLASVLWKLTGDRELFVEAMQYALLGIWRNVEKLNGKKAGAYIYRIALSANSAAWRNRIGKDGQIPKANVIKNPTAKGTVDEEMVNLVRKEIAKLPEQQAQAIVMRYIDQRDYCIIADELNCSEDTARSHVSKALNTLRNNLARLNISEA